MRVRGRTPEEDALITALCASWERLKERAEKAEAECKAKDAALRSVRDKLDWHWTARDKVRAEIDAALAQPARGVEQEHGRGGDAPWVAMDTSVPTAVSGEAKPATSVSDSGAVVGPTPARCERCGSTDNLLRRLRAWFAAMGFPSAPKWVEEIDAALAGQPGRTGERGG